MKKNASVIWAEANEAEKKAAWEAAQMAAEQAKNEYHDAVRQAREARIASDSLLPQCRVVLVGWRSGKEGHSWPAVIERKTPSGILVVRSVGDDVTWRFKWHPSIGKWWQAEKSTGFCNDHRELRDVPEEYMPKAEEVR